MRKLNPFAGMMERSSRPTRWQLVSVLTVGVLAVSTAAVLIRLALQAGNTRGVGFSLMLAEFRVAIASLCLLPVWRARATAPLESKAIACSIGAGIFLALHFATWITSLSYTSVAASVTLVTTNPIWVAIFTWFGWGERPTRTTAVGIALGLVGGGTIGAADWLATGTSTWLGNGLALTGAIAASLYLLLGRSAQRRGLAWQTHAAIAYVTATLVLLPLPPLWGVSYVNWSPSVYGWALLLALGPQLLGHTSLNWSVRWISPTLVTLVLLLEPLGAGLLAFWIFGEVPEPHIWLGAGIVLSGVAIAAVGEQTPRTSASG
ncbi:MAG: DMT family transporter [Cyanobacteria bacterium P01_D01_bin.123]